MECEFISRFFTISTGTVKVPSNIQGVPKLGCQTQTAKSMFKNRKKTDLNASQLF